MRVRHPDAVHGESVVVDGDDYRVDDETGIFEIPDDAERWLDRWCNANGYERQDVVLSDEDGGGSDGSDADADEPEPGTPEAVVDPPFDPVEYTVPELEDALDEGDFDEPELLAIYSAEREADDRTTAVAAIDAALNRLEGG